VAQPLIQSYLITRISPKVLVKFHTKFKINNKCMPEIGKSHNTFDSPLYRVWGAKKEFSNK